MWRLLLAALLLFAHPAIAGFPNEAGSAGFNNGAGGDGGFTQALGGGPPAWVLPGAQIDMDFVNNQYWDGITNSTTSATSLLSLTRATAVSYVNQSGTYSTIASGALAVGNAGLQVQAATNLLAYSSPCASSSCVSGATMNSGWGTYGTGTAAPSVAFCSACMPDGTNGGTFGYVTATAQTNQSQTNVTFTSVAGSWYTCSVFVQAASGTPQINLTLEQNGGTYIFLSTKIWFPSNSGFIAYVTGKASTTSTSFIIGQAQVAGELINYHTNSSTTGGNMPLIQGGSVNVGMAQCNAGFMRIGNVATTGTAVTSPIVDDITASGDLATALTGSAGSVLACVDYTEPLTAATLVGNSSAVFLGKTAADIATASNSLVSANTAEWGGPTFGGAAATPNVCPSGSPVAATTIQLSYGSGAGSLALNGSLAPDSTNRSMSGTVYIGSKDGSTQVWNGNILRLVVYPTNTTLVAAATPLTGFSIGGLPTYTGGYYSGATYGFTGGVGYNYNINNSNYNNNGLGTDTTNTAWDGNGNTAITGGDTSTSFNTKVNVGSGSSGNGTTTTINYSSSYNLYPTGSKVTVAGTSACSTSGTATGTAMPVTGSSVGSVQFSPAGDCNGTTTGGTVTAVNSVNAMFGFFPSPGYVSSLAGTWPAGVNGWPSAATFGSEDSAGPCPTTSGANSSKCEWKPDDILTCSTSVCTTASADLYLAFMGRPWEGDTQTGAQDYGYTYAGLIYNPTDGPSQWPTTADYTIPTFSSGQFAPPLFGSYTLGSATVTGATITANPSANCPGVASNNCLTMTYSGATNLFGAGTTVVVSGLSATGTINAGYTVTASSAGSVSVQTAASGTVTGSGTVTIPPYPFGQAFFLKNGEQDYGTVSGDPDSINEYIYAYLQNSTTVPGQIFLVRIAIADINSSLSNLTAYDGSNNPSYWCYYGGGTWYGGGTGCTGTSSAWSSVMSQITSVVAAGVLPSATAGFNPYMWSASLLPATNNYAILVTTVPQTNAQGLIMLAAQHPWGPFTIAKTIDTSGCQLQFPSIVQQSLGVDGGRTMHIFLSGSSGFASSSNGCYQPFDLPVVLNN